MHVPGAQSTRHSLIIFYCAYIIQLELLFGVGKEIRHTGKGLSKQKQTLASCLSCVDRPSGEKLIVPSLDNRTFMLCSSIVVFLLRFLNNTLAFYVSRTYRFTDIRC